MIACESPSFRALPLPIRALAYEHHADTNRKLTSYHSWPEMLDVGAAPCYLFLVWMMMLPPPIAWSMPSSQTTVEAELHCR